MKQQKQLADKLKQEEQKKVLREIAATIINGQPIIKGLRIMDKTAEILLQALLKIYRENNSTHISFSFDILPECIHHNIGVEFEKLTQYGMSNTAILWMGGGIVDLLPPAISYFNQKIR